MENNAPLWQKNFRGNRQQAPTPDVIVADLPTGNLGQEEEDRKLVDDLLQKRMGDNYVSHSEADDEPGFFDKMAYGFAESWYADKDALTATTMTNIEKHMITDYPEKAAILGFEKATKNDMDTPLWQRVVGTMAEKAVSSIAHLDWINLARKTMSEEKMEAQTDAFIRENYGEDWMQLTPDERRGRIDEETDALLAVQFPNIHGTEAAHSFAAGTGNIGSLVADPLTYAAPAVNTYKALAAVGATYGAIDMTTKGLADKGYVTPSEVAMGIVAGGVGGPALKGIFKGTGKVINKATVNSRIRAASPILDEYEQVLNQATKLGGDWNEATISARLATGTDGPTIQKMYELTGRTFNMDNLPGVRNKLLTTLEEKASNGMIYRAVSGISDALSPYIVPMTDILDKYTPKLFHALRSQDAEMHIRMHTSFQTVSPWLDKFKHMSKADKVTIKGLISTNSHESFRAATTLIRQYEARDPSKFKGFFGDWGRMRSELKRVGDEMKDAGIKFDALDNYFPRVAKNPGKLGDAQLGYLSWKVSKAAEIKGSALNAEEIGVLMKQAILAPTEELKRAPLGGSLRERMVPELNDYLLPHYADPAEALHSYFRTSARDVARAQFFNKLVGKKLKYTHDDSNQAITKAIDSITESAGKGVPDELKNLSFVHRQKIADLLRARFTTGEQSPKQWIQTYKNVGYTVLLGNPLSALTQLGDQAFSIYKYGVRAYSKALFTPKLISKKDIGLTDAMEELFASTSKTKKTLDTFLKISGFNRLDQFGKDMILNSAFHKYTKAVKTQKGIDKVVKKWGKYFEGDTDDLIRGLKDGDVTNENVRLLLWHELADVQPIALSEMPEKYLAMPNGRIFYMLKTFTIKQMSFMKREFLQDFAKGNHIRATRRLVAFSGAWLWANGTADSLKDFVKGDHEKSITDNMTENLLQMATGLTKYNFLSGAREGPVQAAIDFIMPPIPIVDDLAKAAFTQDPTKALKTIPWGGNIIYQRLKSQTKQTAARRKHSW